MKETKVTGTLFETPEAAALAIAILFFCEKVKVTASNVHLKTTPTETQIRDEHKNVLFVMSEKGLVKKLYNFPKQTLSRDSVETAQFVVNGVSTIVRQKEDQTRLLQQLLNCIEESHPRPWLLGAHQDRLIDARGKAFSFLPHPRAGLSSQHLESLIACREQEVGVPQNRTTGTLVY